MCSYKITSKSEKGSNVYKCLHCNAVIHYRSKLPVVVNTAKTIFQHLLRRFSRHTNTANNSLFSSKTKKRPPKLTIGPSEQSFERMAQTTVTSNPRHLDIKNGVTSQSNPRMSSLRNRFPEIDARKQSLPPKYTHSISSEGQSANSPQKPRWSVGLSYNRTVLKPSDTSTPASPDPNPPKFGASEDTYVPHIAVHNKSWSSFLARNYYNLITIKLLLTLFINVLLLSYQVRIIVCACIDPLSVEFFFCLVGFCFHIMYIMIFPIRCPYLRTLLMCLA